MNEHRRTRTITDKQPSVESVNVSGSPERVLSSACLEANGTLALINLACHLLDRQVGTLAAEFETEGGFAERLCSFRKNKRDSRSKSIL